MLSEKQKQGKKNRAAGARFETKVRNNLVSRGWIVDRWNNTVEFGSTTGSDGTLTVESTLAAAKAKYNPFTKQMMMRTGGFPDFVAFKRGPQGTYVVVGIECKTNGYLDPTEREMCKCLVDNEIFSALLVAQRGEKRGTIDYLEFIDGEKQKESKKMSDVWEPKVSREPGNR